MSGKDWREIIEGLMWAAVVVMFFYWLLFT